jgi:transcriptional regulator with XRE-family HTH domain
VVELAARLRQVRVNAQTPSYKRMAAEVHVSVSALADAARGRQFPTWMVVEGYLRACGVDPETWRADYDDLAERHRADRANQQVETAPQPPEPTIEPPARERIPAGRGVWWRRARFIGLAAASVALLLAALTASTGTPPARRPAAAPARSGMPTTTVPRNARSPMTDPPATATSTAVPSASTAPAVTTRTATTSHAPAAPGSTAVPPPVVAVAQSAAMPTGPVLGPGCPDAADFYSYDDPDGDGWHPGATGGCGTGFLYTALNVNKDPNQWQEDAGWTFHNLPSASCTINVWIPVSPDASATAHYWVSTGSQNYNSNIAVFTIDQAAHQGQWYGVPITVSHPTLYVQIDDPGGTAPGQFIAASAVNVHC